jgi:SPP1 family predicted phage head-tail adaptor
MLDPGALDRRITFITPYPEKNSYGEAFIYWGEAPLVSNFETRVANDSGTFEGSSCVLSAVQTLTNTPFKVWAKIDFMTGKEGDEANKLTSVKKAEITVRYNTRINETYRIEWNSITFDIEAILPTGRKDYLLLRTRYTL